MKAEKNDTPSWSHVDYEKGTDPTWDKLNRLTGRSWGAIDGAAPGVRVYATWDEMDDGRMYVTGLHVAGGPINSDLLRAIPIGRLEAAPREVAASKAQQLGPLPRPDSFDDPDEHARMVAAHYRQYAQASNRPAVLMAEKSGVPVATVRRWIHEARLRGHLPPGRRGKTG